MTGGAINELAAVIGTSAACRAVGRSRASYYRHRRPRPDPAVVRARRRAAQPRALTELERAEVLEVLHSDPFVDESPATIYATLLDGGRYLASTSTMYRLLRQAHGGVVERRRHASHPPRSRPELIAEAPKRRMELGYHPPAGTGPPTVLLPVRAFGSLQPLRARLDARLGGAGGAGPAPHR